MSRVAAALACGAIAFAAATDAAALGFEARPLAAAAHSVQLVPVHPDLEAAGVLAYVAQGEEGEGCEVAWLRFAGREIAERFVTPCGDEDGFYNVVPTAGTAGAAPELLAVTPAGVEAVSAAGRSVRVATPTLLPAAPRRKFAGPPLWEDPDTPDGRLRLVVPGLDVVGVWERAADGVWSELERYDAGIEASYNARAGRDTLHPDFHLLASLRMPKFRLGRLSNDEGASRGLLTGHENRVRLVPPGGGGEAGVVALVEDVAAEDQLKAAAHGGAVGRRDPIEERHPPVAVAVGHRRELVELEVVAQEDAGERVDVARRHPSAPTVTDEAGEGEAAADLEDPLGGENGPAGEGGGEVQP